MNYVMLFFEGFFKFTSLNPARNTDNEIIGFAKLVEIVAIRFLLFVPLRPFLKLFSWTK